MRNVPVSVSTKADVIADVILIALPVRLLSDVKLGSARRKLLISIFSANSLTTIFSIIHARYVFSPNRIMEGIWAHVEVCESPLSLSLLCF